MVPHIIRTFRLCIPKPTGFFPDGCRGYTARGYDKMNYDFYHRAPAFDPVMMENQKFYEFISYFYDIDLASLPAVYPYVQYIDYLKSRGGWIAETDADAIDHLRKNCNVLIIPDASERNFVEEMYYYLKGFKPVKQIPVPERFAAHLMTQQMIKGR